MIREAILVATLLGAAVPARAQPALRLRCTLQGAPTTDWRVQDGHARVRFMGEREWSKVSDDAAGPMLALLWAGGAKCEKSRK
jgi:hypothetical protein